MASNHIPEKAQEFYRPKAAAAFLQISVPTFYKWVKDGKIPKGKRIGERIQIWAREDLLSLVA